MTDIYAALFERTKAEISDRLEFWRIAGSETKFGRRGQQQSVRRMWRREIVDLVARAKRYRHAAGLAC